MGRGKRAAAAKRAPVGQGAPAGVPAVPAVPAKPKRMQKGVYARPPWPEEQWADAPDFVTDVRVRDEAIGELLAGFGVRSWQQLAEGPVKAVVSGTVLDNAHGTRPIRLFDKEGREEWFQQELTVYFVKDGWPQAELNVANLCAYVCRKERVPGHQRSGATILDAASLAAFADERGVSWHEPDEQEIIGRAQGQRLDRSADGLRLDLHHAVYDEEKGDYEPAALLATVYFVDLLSWACDWEAPRPKTATRRGRLSPLAARQSA